MRRCILVVASVLLAACPGPSGPPAPDRCNNGGTSGIDTLTLGSGFDTWSPYANGDSPLFAVGGQGLTMLVVRLRITGAAAPACLSQTSTVQASDIHQLVGVDHVARTTYAQADGSRITQPMYIVLEGFFSASSPLQLETTVGGLTQSVSLGSLPSDLGVPDSGTHD
jgi:hypothetical protein